MNEHDRRNNTPIQAGEVKVRLARTGEYPKWDRLMRQHHQLGLKCFAGRGLRYIVEYQGRWVCLSGSQTGSLQSAARDQWIGWVADAGKNRRLFAQSGQVYRGAW